MTIHGTLNFSVPRIRAERGGVGGYAIEFTEVFEMPEGKVGKSKTPNIKDPKYLVIGTGCSAPGCESIIAPLEMPLPERATAFSDHNRDRHNGNPDNESVTLYLALDEIE